MMNNRLLYYCASTVGGIADYAHEQASALAIRGVPVTLLCPNDWPHVTGISYKIDARLVSENGGRGMPRWRSRLFLSQAILRNIAMLNSVIQAEGFGHVLRATYSEYLAPLWAWRMRRLVRRNVVFGAVVHDPIRDTVVGPKWWHTRSVSEGYSYLSHAFVHAPVELDTGNARRQIETTVIPHGSVHYPKSIDSRACIRARFGIPDDAKLFLSFGHIRDGKNLGLVLKAMQSVPNSWLLVAGSEAASGNMDSKRYMHLASTLHVSDRCRWWIGYRGPEDVSSCFEAADFVLLTYSGEFRSASGVLNIAATYERPVLVSCGDSNLGASVEKYNIGVRVSPDDASEIAKGMLVLSKSRQSWDWLHYRHENSWSKNAEIVYSKLFPVPSELAH